MAEQVHWRFAAGLRRRLRPGEQRVRGGRSARVSYILDFLFGPSLPAHEYCENDRIRELAGEAGHVEAALRAAKMLVFIQDRELRYLSVIGPQGDIGTPLLGRTDEEVLPVTERDVVIAAKRKVMATGEALDCNMSYMTPGGRAVFALHIEPATGPDHEITGVSCAALDLSGICSSAGDQRCRNDELKIAVERYELALRESNVTVFTQDRNFGYTSISNRFGGLPASSIIGQTDEILLTENSRGAVVALKRRAMETGTGQNAELALGFVTGGERWFDLHIEPMRDLTGEVIGLVGTAVDITRRKDDEAHQRLLMRELTHRSKNLLAVIQAMARHASRHSRSIQAFMEQFDARLQALATSHDLLIEQGWHGASLEGLARLQLQPILTGKEGQVTISGPVALLKPEAAQALGLAFHELANNAKKYGALSVASGHVSITWRRVPQPEGEGVVLEWRESGGPSVERPTARRFGSMVIERNLGQTLGGGVKLAFQAEGVQCEIQIPPSNLVGVLGGQNQWTQR